MQTVNSNLAHSPTGCAQMNDSAEFTGYAADGRELLGAVFGMVGSYDFDFAVTASVERNEYVQVHHGSYGWLLARVEELKLKTDLDSEMARMVAMGERVDYREEEIAHASIIGFADGKGGISAPKQPVPAGTLVYRADDALIASVLSLSAGGGSGALIGTLHSRSLPVYTDIDTMVQKHISIVAKTGGGKSYLAGVLLEEMLKNRVTTLILDPHGEYATLGEAPDGGRSRFSPDVIEFAVDTEVNPGAQPLRFTCSNFSAAEILSLTPLGENKAAAATLSACMERAKEKGGDYDLLDLAAEMEGDAPAMVQLRKEVEALAAMNVFSEHGTRTDQIANPGKTTIINLKGAVPEVQGLFVRRLLTALFELRKRGKIPPLLVVLEEAHNFCPQQGKTEASRIVRTVAAEGRKFGMGLLVITQRVAKVDKNVLSQCNTQFILKLTNGNDLKAVAASVEGITPEMLEEIPRLTTGVAIAVGGGLPVPVLVDVRRRETRHGGESAALVRG